MAPKFRFMAAIEKLFGKQQPNPEETTLTQDLPKTAGESLDKFKPERVLEARVKLCREMYDSDTRAKTIQQRVARDIVRNGFRVVVVDNEKAQTEIDDLVKRLSLIDLLDDWIRLSFVDGNSFLEVGVNESKEIEIVSRKPTLKMRRNSNNLDFWDDSSRAYYYLPNPTWFNYSPKPPPSAIWFSDWDIIHVRWDHDVGQRYGRPLFSAGTGPYKRMREGEVDMATGRRTGSQVILAHYLDGASPADLQTYMQANRSAIDSTFAAVREFFSNAKGSLDSVNVSRNFDQMADVMHHVQTWWLASPIPMALLGYGQDLSRDVITSQQEAYAGDLEELRTWVTASILKPLFERQLLLKGIFDEAVEYTVQWGTSQALSAATILRIAEAMRSLKQTEVLTDETILQLLARFLPDFDPEHEYEKLQAERLQAPDEVWRLAQAGWGQQAGDNGSNDDRFSPDRPHEPGSLRTPRGGASDAEQRPSKEAEQTWR